MAKEITGLFIPKVILANKQLSSSEKMVLSEVHFLDQTPKGCYASNAHIGEMIRLSKG